MVWQKYNNDDRPDNGGMKGPDISNQSEYDATNEK